MQEDKNSQNAQEKVEEILQKLAKKYEDYTDPWGFDFKTCEKALRILYPIYHNYFKVRVFGQENVENKPYMLVSNHSGQLPIDGILITIAFAVEMNEPRIVRGMVERFLAGLPFLGKLTAELGSVLGDRKNCNYLLERKESILVFPEGVRGVSKNTKDYYKLQKFTTGFFRLAIKNKIDILPIAVIGAEEMYPLVFQAKKLANFLKLPALPIAPFGFFPLPSPIDIYIGEPYKIPEDLSSEAPDSIIREHVYRVESKIKLLMAKGLKDRRPFLDDIRIPMKNYFRELHKHYGEKTE